MPDNSLSFGVARARPPRRPSPVRAFVDAVQPAGGVVSAYKARATYEGDIAQARLIRDVEDGRRALATLHSRLMASRAEASDKHLEVQALEDERAASVAKMEAARDDAALPAAERLAKVGRLRQALELSDRALAAERRRIAAVDAQLGREEAAAIDMEVALQQKSLRLETAREGFGARVQAQRSNAQARAGAEARGGDALARQLAAREAEEREAKARADEAGAQQLQATLDMNQRARQQYAGNSSAREALAAAAGRAATETLVSRANAVLSLKSHLEHSSSETRAANKRRATAAARKAEAQASEYASLLEQGFNPYEVWRARERDVKMQHAVAAHEEAVASARLEVTRKVVDEDYKSRYIEAERADEREVHEEYKRSISRTVREAALTAYIMDKTTSHTDTMDPSGRLFRVEPSQVTVLRPAGFGLGNVGLTRPDVVATVAAKRANRGVGPLAHWVPEELERDGEEGDDGAAAADARAQAQAEAEGGAGPSAGYGDDEGEGGGNATRRVGPRRAFVLRQLSVYEKRLMAQAKARQRANITQKQVVQGREYKGVGFLPAPAALHFKDFAVGEPFEIRFTLTNVSLTFNSFKVLPLPDEIRDLFLVTFTPPGRMSAGMAIPIRVVFVPRQNVDIRSSLQLLAQTGPVNIPLLCTTKKALPIVREPVLDLGDVVLGEHGDGHFTIENEGALPLICVVARASYGGASGNEFSDSDGGGNGGNGSGEDDGEVEGGFHSRRGLERGGGGSPRTPPRSSLRLRLDDDALADALVVAERVELAGYSSARVAVRFAPTAAGLVHVPLELTFFDPPPPAALNGSLLGASAAAAVAAAAAAEPTPSSVRPVQLLAKAAGISVPLFVERETIDLRTCLVGKLYRGSLVVCNRGSTALRCSPAVHPGLAYGPGGADESGLTDGSLDGSRADLNASLLSGASALQQHRAPHESAALVFHPTTGFVQAADSLTGEPGRFEFQIKFRPSADLPDRPELQGCRVIDESGGGSDDERSGGGCGRGRGDDTGPTDETALSLAPLIEVPMLIWAPDQVLPVPFSLRARISSPELSFEPERFDFGNCSLGQAVSLPLTIFNRSALPQKFGFVRLPACFSVDPGSGNGFGLLLPGESVAASVTFSPFGPELYSSRLQCRTTTTGRYLLDVQGRGVRGPVALSHPVLFLAATAVGEIETATVHLTNQTDGELDYEVITPASDARDRPSPLCVLPAVGRLLARQTCRLIVRHSPLQADLDFGLAAQASAPGTLARARAAIEEGGGAHALGSPGSKGDSRAATAAAATAAAASALFVEAAPPAVHNTFQLPIFTRPLPPQTLLDDSGNGVGLAATSRAAQQQQQQQQRVAAGTAAAAGLGGPFAAGDAPPLVQSGVVLQVSTTTVPLILTASRRSVAFGQVPVGYSKQETVRITNHAAVPLELVPAPFAAAVNFSLANAPRTLAPGQYHDLVLSFKPSGHRVFTDRLVVGAKGHGPTLDVVVSGVGVSPQVVIEPAGAGVVDFGAVCAGDSCARALTLHNVSAFPLSFAARQVQATPSLYAPTPVPPFYVDPMEGSVPPNGRATLTVTFAPRHAPSAGLPQSAAFVIDVPNQDLDATQTLLLAGRCFDRAAYLLPALPSEEQLEASPSAVDSAVVVGDPVSVADADGQEMFTLVFPSSSPAATLGGGASHAGTAASAAAPAPTTALPATAGGAPATARSAAPTAPSTAVYKELIVPCINRAEHSGMAAGATQPPSSFSVHVPPTIAPRGAKGQLARPHFFSVEAAEGSVAAGQRQVLRFRFAPPPDEAGAGAGAADGPRLGGLSGGSLPGPLSVGEWQELDCTVTLSGGHVCDGAPVTKTVVVRLRAYVPPRVATR